MKSVKWVNFCADRVIDDIFVRSCASKYAFHYFKCVTMRKRPESFFYAAHLVGTMLGDMHVKSAETWMAFLHSSTFASTVHVSISRCTPALQHLQVWREIPQKSAKFFLNFQRLSKRYLLFTGQRQLALHLLQQGEESQLPSLFKAFESGNVEVTDKALLFAAWILDANPLQMVRRDIEKKREWKNKNDFIPFVSPDFFNTSPSEVIKKRKKTDNLTKHLAFFLAVCRALKEFPEARDIRMSLWIELYENPTVEKIEVMTLLHAHLSFAAFRVRDHALRETWRKQTSNADRVARELRAFYRENVLQCEKLINVLLHDAKIFNKRLCVMEVKACGASSEDIRWLEERHENLLVFFFDDSSEVSAEKPFARSLR